MNHNRLKTLPIRLQAQIGSIISGLGIVWCAQVWTTRPLGVRALVSAPGDVELCALGVLVWLIAKWRDVHRQHQSAPQFPVTA